MIKCNTDNGYIELYDDYFFTARKIVKEPNWFEKFIGITLESKIKKATQQIYKDVEKRKSNKELCDRILK